MKNKTSLNTYRVHRPWCVPAVAICVAESEKEALELVGKRYGYVHDATATIIKEKGVVS
jgi:hypothetical protein